MGSSHNRALYKCPINTYLLTYLLWTAEEIGIITMFAAAVASNMKSFPSFVFTLPIHIFVYLLIDIWTVTLLCTATSSPGEGRLMTMMMTTDKSNVAAASHSNRFCNRRYNGCTVY